MGVHDRAQPPAPPAPQRRRKGLGMSGRRPRGRAAKRLEEVGSSVGGTVAARHSVDPRPTVKQREAQRTPDGVPAERAPAGHSMRLHRAWCLLGLVQGHALLRLVRLYPPGPPPLFFFCFFFFFEFP